MAIGVNATSTRLAASGAADRLAVRRAVLWAMLVAKTLAGWGVRWDIQWHVLIGRDSFWIAPHLLTYAGVTLIVLLSFGTLAWETAGSHPGTLRLLGLRGTRGFHVAAWGIAITVLAAPVDDLWHRLFGLDVTLWSPPHLLGILGAAVNGVGCLVIAREAHPAGAVGRLAALTVAGALLYGTLHLVVEPSFRVAYLGGGVWFHTYAVLAALVLPLALVPAARLSGRRFSPILLIAALLLVNTAGFAVARAGFAWLQPEPIPEADLAQDPTSPIAVAHAIARQNGTTPGGGPSGVTRLLALVPALAMAVVDPRRRPIAATVGYAVVLFGLNAITLASTPAFRPLVPGATETLVALGLAVTAAAASGVGARLLGDALDDHSKLSHGIKTSSRHSPPVRWKSRRS